MSFMSMERGYSTPGFFLEQFQPQVDYPQTWIFMGTRERNGMVYEVFQNFVTGQQEERNARTKQP